MHHTQCYLFSALMMNWTNCKKSRKRDAKHKRDMHQRHACLLWKIHEQERQIHCLMDVLRDNGISQPTSHCRRLASARSDKYSARTVIPVFLCMKLASLMSSPPFLQAPNCPPTNGPRCTTSGQRIGAKLLPPANRLARSTPKTTRLKTVIPSLFSVELASLIFSRRDCPSSRRLRLTQLGDYPCGRERETSSPAQGCSSSPVQLDLAQRPKQSLQSIAAKIHQPPFGQEGHSASAIPAERLVDPAVTTVTEWPLAHRQRKILRGQRTFRVG